MSRHTRRGEQAIKVRAFSVRPSDGCPSTVQAVQLEPLETTQSHGAPLAKNIPLPVSVPQVRSVSEQMSNSVCPPCDRPAPPIDTEWFETNALALIDWVMHLAALARENAGTSSAPGLEETGAQGGSRLPQLPAVPA